MEKINLKTGFRIAFVCLLFLVLSGCKKEKTVYDCYFYTNAQDLPGKLDLYVDNEYKGKLPTLNVDNRNFPDSLKSRTILLKLEEGKYEINVLDDQGNEKVKSKISFSSRKTSVTGTMGGSNVSAKDKELFVELYY